jgi:hypothetical protein
MPTATNVEDVKLLLNARETAINTLFEKIEKLEDTRTYKILKSGAGQSPPQLIGKSKHAVDDAFAMLSAAVLNIGALADLVSARSKAFEHYQSKVLKDPVVLEGIHTSLKNDLVEINALPKCSSGFATLTPGGQTASVTPEALQAVLEADFKTAKATIEEIEQIWTSQVTLVNDYNYRIAGLETRAAAAGKTRVRDLERAKEAVLEASNSINLNPLEANTAFTTTVEPLLIAVESILQSAQEERRAVLKAINDAERKWRSLRPISLTGDELWQNVQLHIDSPTPCPRADKTQIDSLRTSLTAIGAERLTAVPTALQTKLTEWNAEADAFLAIETGAQEAFQSLLQQRLGLVARLTAFTGQAKAAKVYDDPSLLPTAEEALRLLGPRVQTPLAQATGLLRLYEQRLQSLV